MLTERALAITALVLFAYWVPLATPIEFREIKSLFSDALQQPQLVSRLPLEDISIMRSVEYYPSLCTDFAQYAKGRYSPKDLLLLKDDPFSLRVFINAALYTAAQARKHRVLEVFRRALIPLHPFSQELEGRLCVGEFLHGHYLTFNSFLNAIIEPIFNEKWKEIFTNLLFPRYAAKYEFSLLLIKHKSAFSWDHSQNKHACTFLRSLGFEGVLGVFHLVPESHNCYSNMHLFASKVYQAISHSSSQRVIAVLRKISPPVYSTATDPSYSAVIDAYLRSTKEPTLTEQLREHIGRALKNPKLSKAVPHIIRSILHALAEGSELYYDFLEHASRFGPRRDFSHRKEQLHFWAEFVEESFTSFVAADRQKAQQLFQNFMIHSDPFLAQDHTIFTRAARFLAAADHMRLVDFIDQSAKSSFKLLIGQIASEPDETRAKARLLTLLHNYSVNVSGKHPREKYACAFLMNAGLQHFKVIAGQSIVYEGLVFESLDSFASRVYTQISSTAGEQEASRLIERVLPQVYLRYQSEEYSKVIDAYVASGLEPVDVQHFKNAIADIFTSLEIPKDLPPAYRAILLTLQKGEDSQVCENLIYYCFDNYRLQNFLPEIDKYNYKRLWQYKAHFWCSLVFSSLRKLQVAYLGQVQATPDSVTSTETPSLASIIQDPMVFAEPMVFSSGVYSRSDDFFVDIAGHGHFESVKSILERNRRRSSNLKDAFIAAAEMGHIDLVRHFVENLRVDPSAEECRALILAALYGHMEVVKYLTQAKQVDANAQNGLALRFAAYTGRIHLVKYFVEVLGVSPTSHDGDALVKASRTGQLRVVKYLIEEQKVDPNIGDGACLVSASMTGEIEVVRYLLGPRVRMTEGKGVAVLRAWDRGHQGVVQCLYWHGAPWQVQAILPSALSYLCNPDGTE